MYLFYCCHCRCRCHRCCLNPRLMQKLLDWFWSHFLKTCPLGHLNVRQVILHTYQNLCLVQRLFCFCKKSRTVCLIKWYDLNDKTLLISSGVLEGNAFYGELNLEFHLIQTIPGLSLLTGLSIWCTKKCKLVKSFSTWSPISKVLIQRGSKFELLTFVKFLVFIKKWVGAVVEA